MDRRTFTVMSSLAAAGTAVASGSRAAGAAGIARPKAGLIGCGWFGGVVLTSMAEHAGVEFVSLCDPNANAVKATLQALAKYQKTVPKTFADYREMLASEAHDIVVVSTPDHWHALPAIAAMKAGADVYLEKPISVDVMEGEALVAAARKYKRVVQVNTQRRSTPCLIEARDKYLRAGRLGAIGLVESYSYLPSRPKDVMADVTPPAHINYELWTGPAPMLPFKAALESRTWRAFMEYGNGQIGDLGIHMLDCVRWMLDLGWPISITSTGGIYVDKSASSNISDTQRSQFRYPGLDVSWEHRTWGVAPIPQRHWTDLWGARFIGEKGTLNVTMLGYEFTPTDGGPREGFHMLAKGGDLQNLDPSTLGSGMSSVQRAHVMDFMKARETRSRPVADIEQGHISTACCILANLAQEVGRPLSYDPATRTVRGDAEATRRLTRSYRSPWVHPEPVNV
jgi:predicted dehydrogenase